MHRPLIFAIIGFAVLGNPSSPGAQERAGNGLFGHERAAFVPAAPSPQADQWQTELPFERYKPEVKSGGILGFVSAIFSGIVTGIGIFPESTVPRPEQWKRFEDLVDVHEQTDAFLGAFGVGIGANELGPQVAAINAETRRLNSLSASNLFDPTRGYTFNWNALLTGKPDLRNAALDNIVTAIGDTRLTVFRLRVDRDRLREQGAFDRRMSAWISDIGGKMQEIGAAKVGSIMDYLMTGSKILLIGVEMQSDLSRAFFDRANAAEMAARRAEKLLQERASHLEKLDAQYRAAEKVHKWRTDQEFVEDNPDLVRLVRDWNSLRDARIRGDDEEKIEALEEEVKAGVRDVWTPGPSNRQDKKPEPQPEAPKEEARGTMDLGGGRIATEISEKEAAADKYVLDNHVWKPGTSTVYADVYLDQEGNSYFVKVKPYELDPGGPLTPVNVPDDLFTRPDEKETEPEPPPKEEKTEKTPNPCMTGQLGPEDCPVERPLWTDDSRARGTCTEVTRQPGGRVFWTNTSSDCRNWRALYRASHVDCPEGTVLVAGRCMDPLEAACLEDPAMALCEAAPDIDPVTGCPRGQIMDVLLQMCRDPKRSACDDELNPELQKACLERDQSIDCPQGTEKQGRRCIDPETAYCERAGAGDIRCMPERFDVCAAALHIDCGAPDQGQPQPPIPVDTAPSLKDWPAAGKFIPQQPQSDLARQPEFVWPDPDLLLETERRSTTTSVLTDAIQTHYAATAAPAVELQVQDEPFCEEPGLLTRGIDTRSLDPGPEWDPIGRQSYAHDLLIGELFEGLTVLAGDGEARLGMAATISRESIPRTTDFPDHLQWTFGLRPDVRWSDGEPVTAFDFVRAFTRLRQQGLMSDVEYRAVDARTIQIIAPRSDHFILERLALPAYVPLPESGTIDTNFDPPALILSDNTPTNGPRSIAEWMPGNGPLLRQSPHYHGAADRRSVRLVALPPDGDRSELLKLGFADTAEDLPAVGISEDSFVSSDPRICSLQVSSEAKPEQRRGIALDAESVKSALKQNGFLPSDTLFSSKTRFIRTTTEAIDGPPQSALPQSNGISLLFVSRLPDSTNRIIAQALAAKGYSVERAQGPLDEIIIGPDVIAVFARCLWSDLNTIDEYVLEPLGEADRWQAFPELQAMLIRSKGTDIVTSHLATLSIEQFLKNEGLFVPLYSGESQMMWNGVINAEPESRPLRVLPPRSEAIPCFE
jgi:hypothetical protein